MSKDKRKPYVTFKDIYTRVTDFVKSEDVIINGEDNLYPSTNRRVIYQSPTASLAVRALIDFISGNGVRKDYVINKQTGQLLSDFVSEFATSIAEQYGAFIQVSYELDENLDLKPVNPVIIPYTDVRISKKDDSNNDGLLYVADWESKSGGDWLNSVWSNVVKDDKKKFYPFNPKQNIVREQIKKDSKGKGTIKDALRKYKGQILHVNLTPQFPYALSLFNAVLNDADSESRVSMYTNSQLRNGFMGKTIAVTNGLDEEAVKAVREWIGIEGAVGITHINLEHTSDLSEAIKIDQIESQYDENKISETKEYLKKNILGAAKNLPENLVMSSDGVFSQSGEAIEQLKLFYSQQTEKERRVIEKTLEKLGFKCEIIPITEKKETENVID